MLQPTKYFFAAAAQQVTRLTQVRERERERERKRERERERDELKYIPGSFVQTGTCPVA